jgi:subtilisin-like proprotein convertase family protein
MPQLGLGYALGFPLGWVYALTNQIEVTADDALDLLIQLLPRGASKLYGLWQKSGDPYNFYAGIADALKAFCYDYLALLRAEINPQTATYKLGDFEAALGIAGTHTSLFGTPAARRAAIISKFREQGAFTVSNLRGILGPLLGYADPTQLKIVEADRAALTTAHTYAGPTFTVANVANNQTSQVFVKDDGGCSDAGAALTINVTCANPAQLQITLTTSNQGAGENGQMSVTWPRGALPATASGQSITLYTRQIADIFGAKITGWWTLNVDNSVGHQSITVNSWSVFVEGGSTRDVAGNSGRGMAMHEWSAVFETAKSTSTPDFLAATLALARISPAESDADVVRGTTDLCDDPLCVSPFISA